MLRPRRLRALLASFEREAREAERGVGGQRLVRKLEVHAALEREVCHPSARARPATDRRGRRRRGAGVDLLRVGDHFDRAATRALPRTVPVVTTPGGAAARRRHGFGAARGLRTWQTLTVAKEGARLRITALPASHAYGVLGRILPPVMGSLLEFQRAPDRRPLRLCLTGDTLVVPALDEIAARRPALDVLLPHLGGTRLLGLFLATTDGRQGVELMRPVPARTVIPIHYGDFTLYRSPLEDFRREVVAAGLDAWVAALLVGGVVAVVGAVLVQRGLSALKREELAPRQTVETLKEDARWAKEQVS